jgi:hypothetical protein
MTPVLTNGEATENMAIAAGKGPKTQKIGLKEQAPVLVQRVSDSASSQIACWSYRSATQGARGRLPQASRASLPPVPVPNPSGEERAADAPSSYNAPRSRPRLLTHAPHRDQHEAFEAIARTLPLGSVGYENHNERGEPRGGRQAEGHARARRKLQRRNLANRGG